MPGRKPGWSVSPMGTSSLGCGLGNDGMEHVAGRAVAWYRRGLFLSHPELQAILLLSCGQSEKCRHWRRQPGDPLPPTCARVVDGRHGQSCSCTCEHSLWSDWIFSGLRITGFGYRAPSSSDTLLDSPICEIGQSGMRMFGAWLAGAGVVLT